MKSNKKGFTLVELLAVIVILVIISVFAINKVNDVMKKNNITAVKTNGASFIKLVNDNAGMSRATGNFQDGFYSTDDVISMGVKISGTKPDSGSVIIADGKVAIACLVYEKYHINYENNKFSEPEKGECSTSSTGVYEFAYKGSVQTWTVPFSAQYKLEVWGAQGGYANTTPGGNGGYSTGVVNLTSGTTLYIYVGGQGVSDDGSFSAAAILDGGFNGGGYGRAWGGTSHNGAGGGGASDIRIENDSLNNRVIVAGGGGGASDNGRGKFAGGFNSEEGNATISSGYSFGVGQNTTYTGGECGGAGGGWYGGYAGNSENYPGYGGSGYVYTEQTASSCPSCGLSNQYYLTNATTLDGEQPFNSPTGSIENGHTGNGYVRISLYNSATAGFNKTFANYTELDYIESTGTYAEGPYINTLWKASPSTKIVFDGMATYSPSGNYYFQITGGRSSYHASNAIQVAYSTYYNAVVIDYGTAGSDRKSVAADTKFNVSIENNNLYIDGVNVNQAGTFSGISPYPLWIFDENNAGSGENRFIGRIYTYKIYDNNVLVRDFRPCIHKTDLTKVGLCDMVTGTFFGNSGVNNFSPGYKE